MSSEPVVYVEKMMGHLHNHGFFKKNPISEECLKKHFLNQSNENLEQFGTEKLTRIDILRCIRKTLESNCKPEIQLSQNFVKTDGTIFI